MTSGMNLGLDPETLRVILTTGGDFDATIELENGTWDADELLTIVLPTTSWAATRSGNAMIWHVDDSVADTIDSGPTVVAKLKYTKTAGSLTQIWEIGTVIRRG